MCRILKRCGRYIFSFFAKINRSRVSESGAENPMEGPQEDYLRWNEDMAVAFGGAREVGQRLM